jgi:C1A family cysteine protease
MATRKGSPRSHRGDGDDQQFDEMTANEARGFSAFGGHRLSSNGGAEAVAVGAGDTALLSLGIEDAEQLIAMAAIPEVQAELSAALGIDDAALSKLVEDMLQMLPRDRALLVSSPSPAEFGTGVLPPTAEMRAELEMMIAESAVTAPAVALPSSVNLIPWMSPIRNQASRGTCVSFTLTALNEYVLRRRGLVRDLSEQHLYYEIKLIDGSPAGCGTWQAKAVTALAARGQCREVVWPYNPAPPCNNHGARPAAARPDGLHYRLKTLAVAPRDVLAYKSHMARQRPVTLSIPVYNSWYQSAETRRSGRITMRVGNEPSVGGHAVCLVGYQDTPASPGGGFFIVRNSWSTTWAYASPYGAGYGAIPYAYIANDGWEAFTAAPAHLPFLGDEATDDEERDGDEGGAQGKGRIVIQVGSNIKVTIES